MNLKSRNKVDPAFSLSSMTDIVFLLLIFFMLTSSFIKTTSIKVSVPNVNNQSVTYPTVNVVLTKDKKIYVNDEPAASDNVKAMVQKELSSEDPTENVIVIRADKEVMYDDVMRLVGTLKELNAIVSLGVDQEK